jgi:hypothetical protein
MSAEGGGTNPSGGRTSQGNGGSTSTSSTTTGGSTSTGGVSTGGVSTGGSTSTGATSTGGVSTGGVSTGGSTSTGATSTGGVSTGGVSTGGSTSTGGTSNACTGVGDDVFVDPAAGSTDGNGSPTSPLKTIERASTLAAARCAKTIWLLDGTYDSTTEPRFAGSAAGNCGENSGVVLPPGVTLRAANSGRAKLVISGGHGLCLSGGRISGLAFDRPAVGGQVVEASDGDLDVEATTFNHCGFPGVSGLLQASETASSLRSCLILSGNAHARLLTSAPHPWLGDTVGTFAVVRDSGKLEASGGSFDFAPGSATMVLFATKDQAQLLLSKSELVSHAEQNGIALQVQDGSRVSLTGTTAITGFAVASSIDTSDSTVLFEDVMSTRNLYFTQVSGAASGKSNLTLRRTTVSGATAAVLIRAGNVSLSVENSEFTDNTAGILSNGTGKLSIVDSRITSNGIGLRTQPTAGSCAVYIRRTEVSNNTTAGVLLGGMLDGSYDLGTATSRGDNVFVDNASTNGANLLVAGGHTVRVFAVGNTWNASVQGAGADGHYTTVGTATTLDVNGGAGPNYIALTPATIRLAEVP